MYDLWMLFVIIAQSSLENNSFRLWKVWEDKNFVLGLYKMGKACYNIQAFKQCTGGSMDRASDSGSEGWGFESLPVYH